MKKSMVALSVSLCLGLTLYVSFPRQAEACCGDGAIAAAGAQSAGASVAAAITTSTTTIVGWLTQIQASIAQGFMGVMSEINKQTAQIKQIEEASLITQEAMRMEQIAADARTKFEPSPRACYEVAGGAAIGVAGGEVKETAASLNAAAADRTLKTTSSAAVVKKSVELSKTLGGKDVRADTLYNATSIADPVAAQALANNMLNPIPTQTLPKGFDKSPQGQVFAAEQMIEQARMSVAYASVNAAIAAKTPVKGLGSAAMFSKADVSEQELMQAMVNGRFESPGWYSMLAGMDELNLLREQNKQIALGLWMDLKRYQQFERIEANLATQLAIAVKGDSAGRLDNARNAALRR